MLKKKIVTGLAILIASSFAAPVIAETNYSNSSSTVVGDTDNWVAARRKRRRRAKIAAPAPVKMHAGWAYMAKRMRPPKSNKWKSRWNELGYEGWELVAVSDNLFIFKRPMHYSIAPSAMTKPPKKSKKARKAKKKRGTATSATSWDSTAKDMSSGKVDRAAAKAKRKADKAASKAASSAAKAETRAAREVERAAKRATAQAEKEAKRAAKQAAKEAKAAAKAAAKSKL